MGDESEIAELRRRSSVLEQDAEGERTVSRHTLRKVNDVEGAVLDLTKVREEPERSYSGVSPQPWYAAAP